MSLDSSSLRADTNASNADELSVRLQLVASYFALSGILSIGAAIYQAVLLVTGHPLDDRITGDGAVRIALLVSTGALWLITSHGLYKQRRYAGVLALVGIVVWSSPILTGRWASTADIVFLAVGAVMVLTSLRELRS
jgi:hypothetical protein